MLEFFYSNEFDNEIVLKNGQKSVTKKVLKQLVSANLPEVMKKKDNVVLIADNVTAFTVNFYSAVFAKKNIFLIDDIKKIKDLPIEFDILNSFRDIPAVFKEFPKVDPEKINVNFFTSGSSGKSKEVNKNLAGLIREGHIVNETLEIKDKNLTVTTSTSCGHLFGLTFGFMFPLCNGFSIYTDTIEYPDLYDAENSVFISTPAFLDAVRKNNIILNQAKYILSAGSKLKKETFEYLEKFTNVIEIYGSTETGAIACKRNSKAEKLTLLKNVEIESKEDSAIVRTPYDKFKPIEINDRIEVYGSEILLKNRTDRLLKIQEKRISAEAIENSLNENPLVFESYCFKNQDKIACMCALSETGKKYLTENGLTELTKKLKNYLVPNFEIIPQRWRFTDEIPKTKAGKIDKTFIEHIFNINISFPVVLDRKIHENNVSLKIYLHKNCDFYSGHFPEFPITPGVVQLYFASFWGERYFKEKLAAGQTRRIKFNSIIHAGEIVTLNLEKKCSNVSFEYKKEDKLFSSGVFSCENIFEGV